MGISSTTTVTCDCCGYVLAAGEQYQAINVLTFQPTGQVVETPRKYFCHAKNCDAHYSNALTSTFSTARTTHQALVIGGVIPSHP